MRRYAWIILVTLLSACGWLGDRRLSGPERAALQWAEEYFNFQLERSAQHATPESMRWLQFAASNISDADIDAVRSSDYAVEVEALGNDAPEADSLTVVRIEVRNAFLPKDIGNGVEAVKRATFAIPMKKRDGRWMVHLSSVPRPLP